MSGLRGFDEWLSREPDNGSGLLLDKETHGDLILYTVLGEAGAIQVMFYAAPGCQPEPGPLHIHSATPMAGVRRDGPCDILGGGRCWRDVAFRGGVTACEILNDRGEDALYDYLEGWYEDKFGEQSG